MNTLTTRSYSGMQLAVRVLLQSCEGVQTLIANYILMAKEVWKSIKGYEGIYEVSNFGNVKSLSRKHHPKESIMTPNNVKGYAQINLVKNHKRKMCYIHRLVANAFIKNLKNKKEVNHKDGKKMNNCVENLEWNTSLENARHSKANNLNDFNRKKINQKKDGKVVCTFESAMAAARSCNGFHANIVAVCRGKRKTASGFSWSYN